MEPPVIKSIESAADVYTGAREKFQKASVSVQDARTKLIEVMQANADKLAVDGDGNRIYRFDDELVVLTETAKVKVKSAIESDEYED